MGKHAILICIIVTLTGAIVSYIEKDLKNTIICISCTLISVANYCFVRKLED